jgi:hypothetical protein
MSEWESESRKEELMGKLNLSMMSLISFFTFSQLVDNRDVFSPHTQIHNFFDEILQGKKLSIVIALIFLGETSVSCQKHIRYQEIEEI